MVKAIDPQTYMRIVSAAIFYYDFLVTIPTEFRMYQRQRDLTRPSHACMLFFASRYIGLAAITSGVVIYFIGLTESECDRLFPLIGALRSILATVTSLVLLWRTWAIWGRDRRVLMLMAIALVPTTVFTYGYLFRQVPFFKNGTCSGVSGSGIFGLKWPFALANLIYDLIACVVSSVKLIQHLQSGSGVSGIPAILLSDGIGYFLIVCVGHILNLYFLLLKDKSEQNIFLQFNVALTAILSQRIITSLSERITVVPSSFSSRSKSRSKSRGQRPAAVGGAAPAQRTWRSFLPSAGPRGESDIELARQAIPISIGVHTETQVAGDDSSVFVTQKRGGEDGLSDGGADTKDEISQERNDGRREDPENPRGRPTKVLLSG